MTAAPLGALAGIGFALCGVPAAWRCYRAGNANGVPILTAWLIFVSGIAMYFYLFFTYGWNPLLAVNYAVEVGSWGVVLSYRYMPGLPRPPSRLQIWWWTPLAVPPLGWARGPCRGQGPWMISWTLNLGFFTLVWYDR